uniref:RNA/RNP complex-1-interacting phosphatase (inferred by orthology to a human protein) n=1 Tax=Strongyloides venezuelensis TaxID=75913 RepID=A0A0K0F238_STRVS
MPSSYGRIVKRDKFEERDRNMNMNSEGKKQKNSRSFCHKSTERHEKNGFIPTSLKLPKGWGTYQSPIGKVIEGTQFLPFKTPLHNSYFTSHGTRLPPEATFRPQDLIDHCKKKNINLGLIIDLTSTNRYYDKYEFIKRKIRHYKLPCSGHEIHQNEPRALEFIQIVHEFLSDQNNCGKVVGVHCTHGLNRTGYMICRYMTDVMGFSAKDATEAFEKARGYTMVRVQYKEHLYLLEEERNNSGNQSIVFNSMDNDSENHECSKKLGSLTLSRNEE